MTPSPVRDPTSLLEGIGWRAFGTFRPDESRRPFIPRPKHILTIVPFLFRFLLLTVSRWWHNKGVFINFLYQHFHRAHTGVPIGGLGSGSIGRDFRGGFNRFALIPGMKELWVGNVKANQFIVTVRSVTGQLLTQRLLTCAPQKSAPLQSWDQSFEDTSVRYRGLYPRSWTEYALPERNLYLVCEQITPVIADDYKDSCLPVSSFVWHIVNRSQTDYRISITMTWRNGTGNAEWEKESVCRVSKASRGPVEGIELAHRIRGLPLTYGVYAAKDEKDHSVSVTSFDPTGDGRTVWRALADDGNLSSDERLIEGARECGIAVCVEGKVFSGDNDQMEFVLVWDMPEVQFGKEAPTQRRRYTRFFNGDEAAGRLGEYAIANRKEWQRRIDDWQGPVVNDDKLPEWYRSALFNELYYASDGSASWIEYEDDSTLAPHTVSHFKEYGRFCYMESWEYLMANTYDVHFYASAAFLENWPQLEVSMQLDYAEQVNREDLTDMKTLMDGHHTIVKKRGRVPHDLGHPLENIFANTNAYMFHDTGEWKDLNLKFVLSSYRDYERSIKGVNKDAAAILNSFFELSMQIIHTGQKEWDHDHDGIIENSGFPDQTYDIWTMSGTSAYCGSLWIGAVEAARRMAIELGRKEAEVELSALLERATTAYVKKLWNGKYFNYDETSKEMMADQLCGVWFMAAHDNTKEKLLIPEDKINSALSTIFANNVKGFARGTAGAANGMTESGDLDLTAIQSEEMWTGTTYSLASFFALMGDRDRCFATASGVYTTCWLRSGLQWQTPEAVFERHFYRAIGYMRPLAIWTIHRALQAKP